MPIGWLIGLSIGFMICGWSLMSQGKYRHSTQTRDNIGATMVITNVCALIGTIIELLVR